MTPTQDELRKKAVELIHMLANSNDPPNMADFALGRALNHYLLATRAPSQQTESKPA